MTALLWSLAFLAASYLEGTGLLPVWLPDLGIALLLLGPARIPGFGWVAFLGGLLRGGLGGWIHFPLIHTLFALVEPPLRLRLNFESLAVRLMWFLLWAALLGGLLSSPLPRAIAGGVAAFLLSLALPAERI